MKQLVINLDIIDIDYFKMKKNINNIFKFVLNVHIDKENLYLDIKDNVNLDVSDEKSLYMFLKSGCENTCIDEKYKCYGNRMIRNRDGYSCFNCGKYFDNEIIIEKDAFNDHVSKPDKNLSTTISNFSKPWTRYIKYSNLVDNTNLFGQEREFKILMFNNRIPDVIIDKSIDKFKKLNSTKHKKKTHGLKGGNKSGLQAVCLYYAYIENNTPRDKNDIISLLGINNSIFNKGHKLYISLCKMLYGNIFFTDKMKYINIKDDLLIDSIFISLEIDFKYRKYISGLYHSFVKVCFIDFIRHNKYSIIYSLCHYFYDSIGLDKTVLLNKKNVSKNIVKKCINIFKENEKSLLNETFLLLNK